MEFDTRFCNCGIPVVEAENVCIRCKREVSTERMALISANQENENKAKKKSSCLKCGESVITNQRFCGSCGEKIDWSSLLNYDLSQHISAENGSAVESISITKDSGNKEKLSLNSKWLLTTVIVVGIIFMLFSFVDKSGEPKITEEQIERIIESIQEEETKNIEYQNCLNSTFAKINSGQLIFGVTGSTASVYQYCERYKP